MGMLDEELDELEDLVPDDQPKVNLAFEPCPGPETGCNGSSQIVVFIGDRGSGKSLSMVALAYEIQQAQLSAGFPRKPIVTNMLLYEPMQAELIEYPKVKGKKIPWFKYHGKMMLLDEGQVFIDSRTGMSHKNRYATYFVDQTRKRHLDLFATTQRFGKVDIRVRDLTDWVVRCHNVKGEKGGLWIKQDWFKAPFEIGMPITKVRWLRQEQVWDLYETDYVILPEE